MGMHRMSGRREIEVQAFPFLQATRLVTAAPQARNMHGTASRTWWAFEA